MVTLDQKVENVGVFKGDLQAGRRDYERAKQGSELLGGWMPQFEGAVKAQTGFNELNLPSDQTTTTIESGLVKFLVDSFTKTKRPKYKAAVEGMENYLKGISVLLSQGRTITGILKEGRSTYIRTDSLLNAFDLIVAGVMELEVKHTITYEVSGALADEGVIDELVLGDPTSAGEVTESNSRKYIRADRLRPVLERYVKAYEKALAKGQRKEKKTKAVTSKSAYTTTRGKSEGPDWAYVVKTLIKVPTDEECVGELNALADEDVSKAEKERQFPWYKLKYMEPRGVQRLYVSIQSVYDRIQSLKEGKTVEADRLQVEPKEIV